MQTHQLTLHEPVILVFSVKNNSSQMISLDLGQDRKGGFSFSITRPDGSKLNLPRYLREGLAAPGSVTVGAGESYSEDILLNEWYDFSIAGNYVVEGRLSQPVVTALGAETDSGFRETLTIGPRDEVALNKSCGALADQVEGSRSYESAAQATLALSYVRDPVAVPYLRRVLFSDKPVESIAIKGLEGIQDRASVNVLAEALDRKLRDATLARAALVRMERSTTDLQLRQEIDRVLSQI